MEDDKEKTAWESLLYRLQKEFDLRYVIKDGVWKIVVALSITGAGSILLAFLIALVAVATHKLGL